VKVIEPVNYGTMLGLIRASYIILTDSGGLQEEATTLGVPCVVIRKSTERIEAVEEGISVVTGIDGSAIMETSARLLEDPEKRNEMARASSLFGDGKAAFRIAETLLR